MRDGVADVLAQRATLDRGAGVGIAVSLLLHGALTAAVVYAATHASPPRVASLVSIEFAKMPGAVTPAARPKAKPVEAPKIEEPAPKPEPKITEPKPVVEKVPAKVEKNTVPLSPFGRSTKKGSETPPAAKPAPAPPSAPATGLATSTAEVPIGESGVTGLDGGNFPHTLYLRSMHKRIGTNWFRPQVPSGTAVVIYFRIERDGTISEVKVETSSGNGTFDRAAMSAVQSSSKLNPLPFAYAGTYLGVHLTFR